MTSTSRSASSWTDETRGAKSGEKRGKKRGGAGEVERDRGPRPERAERPERGNRAERPEREQPIDRYEQPPPKSTGREKYTAAALEGVIAAADAAGCSKSDVITTLADFTATTIAGAIDRFVRPRWKPARVIAAGGGVHNRYLMARLRDLLPDIELETADSRGLHPDAKEAVCFALLAHETLNGHPTNLPSVTGASGGTVLGKICVPL